MSFAVSMTTGVSMKSFFVVAIHMEELNRDLLNKGMDSSERPQVADVYRTDTLRATT